MSASTKLVVSAGRTGSGPEYVSGRESVCVCILTVFEKVYELLDAVCTELLAAGDIVGEEGDDKVGEKRRLCIRAGRAP